MLPACTGRDTFDAGFGGCETYDISGFCDPTIDEVDMITAEMGCGSSFDFCEADGALPVCSECGECADETAGSNDAPEEDAPATEEEEAEASCPATCYGETCDYWLDPTNGGLTCVAVQEMGCDCSGCSCDILDNSPEV